MKLPRVVTFVLTHTGTVECSVTGLSWTARKNSFQAKMKQSNPVAARPVETMGNMTSLIWPSSPVPSIWAASMSSRGTSPKNERSIQMASGRFMAVYRMMSTSRVFSSSQLPGEDPDRQDRRHDGQELGRDEEEQDVAPLVHGPDRERVGGRDRERQHDQRSRRARSTAEFANASPNESRPPALSVTSSIAVEGRVEDELRGWCSRRARS